MRTLLTLFLCAPLCAGGLPYDKKCHAVAGAVAYVAGYEIARACDSKHPKLWGLASSLAVGLAKEYYDKKHPSCHSCECGDVVANLGGAFVMSWVWRF